MANIPDKELDHMIEILMTFKHNVPVEYRWKNFEEPIWTIASEYHVIDFNWFYYRMKDDVTYRDDDE